MTAWCSRVVTVTRPGENWLRLLSQLRPNTGLCSLLGSHTALSLSNHCIYQERGEYSECLEQFYYLLNCHKPGYSLVIISLSQAGGVQDHRHTFIVVVVECRKFRFRDFPALLLWARVIISSMHWSRCKQCHPTWRHQHMVRRGHYPGQVTRNCIA